MKWFSNYAYEPSDAELEADRIFAETGKVVFEKDDGELLPGRISPIMPPGESVWLDDVVVQRIGLVRKAANQQKFYFVKSEDGGQKGGVMRGVGDRSAYTIGPQGPTSEFDLECERVRLEQFSDLPENEGFVEAMAVVDAEKPHLSQLAAMWQRACQGADPGHLPEWLQGQFLNEYSQLDDGLEEFDESFLDAIGVPRSADGVPKSLGRGRGVNSGGIPRGVGRSKGRTNDGTPEAVAHGPGRQYLGSRFDPDPAPIIAGQSQAMARQERVNRDFKTAMLFEKAEGVVRGLLREGASVTDSATKVKAVKMLRDEDPNLFHELGTSAAEHMIDLLIQLYQSEKHDLL